MLLGLLLLITTLSNAANQRKFNKRGNVLILGAGLAGVAAAKELVLNGFNVDIIEAYSEPGGRLKFKLWNDSVIELGANWVHGVGSSRINPILQLLMDSSMDMTVTNFNDFNLYDHYGKIKRDEFKESQERFNDFMNKLKDYAELRRNESLVDMDVRTALEIIGWDIQNPLDQLVEYLKFDFEIAEAPDSTSLHFAVDFKTYQVFGDDVKFINDKRGYSEILKATIRNFESINVHYNTIVKEIIYGQPLEKGVTIITESNKIQKTFQADYVIVTFSLGVLKSKDVLFTPTLPPWKVESLMRFHMTIYTKIFFKFKANFWGDKEFTYFASQTRGYYPIWQSIPGNILFVTVTGSESKRLERMSDDDVFKEAMAVLKLLFKSKFQKPIDMVFPRWGIDPFFRGSYSNWPMGELQEHFVNMCAPLTGNCDGECNGSDQVVWFAGEHTSADYFGYAHGAWTSGTSVGKEVAECLRGKCAIKRVFEKIKSCSQVGL